MTLDDEPVTRLVGLASGIEVKTRKVAERSLRPLGLTHSQFGVLTAVAAGDGHTQRELADRLETDVNTVMVVCSALERKGFILRRVDPSDRRVRRVGMTARGRRIYERALRVVEELYAPMVRFFPVAELDAVMPILQRIYVYLREREAGQEKRARR